MSGRIAYHKVLGEKNPADLLTKFMTAELAGKHLATLNMKMTEGRAESAPSLSSIELREESGSSAASLVYGWYVDSIDKNKTEKKVKSDAKVQYRGNPARGRFRKTPERGRAKARFITMKTKAAKVQQREMDIRDLQMIDGDATVNGAKDDDFQEEIQVNMNESQVMKLDENMAVNWQELQKSRPRWADVCEDPDDLNERDAMIVHKDIGRRERAKSGDAAMNLEQTKKIEPHRGSDEEGRRGRDGNSWSSMYRLFCFFCFANCASAGVSMRQGVQRDVGASGRASRDDRLPGRHLEGGCPAPIVRRRIEFARRIACYRPGQPSSYGIGRRRSVECGGRTHAFAGAHVQMNASACTDSHVCALPCSRTHVIESQAHVFSVVPRLKPILA